MSSRRMTTTFGASGPGWGGTGQEGSDSASVRAITPSKGSNCCMDSSAREERRQPAAHHQLSTRLTIDDSTDDPVHRRPVGGGRPPVAVSRCAVRGHCRRRSEASHQRHQRSSQERARRAPRTRIASDRRGDDGATPRCRGRGRPRHAAGPHGRAGASTGAGVDVRVSQHGDRATTHTTTARRRRRTQERRRGYRWQPVGSPPGSAEVGQAHQRAGCRERRRRRRWPGTDVLRVGVGPGPAERPAERSERIRRALTSRHQLGTRRSAGRSIGALAPHLGLP